MFVKNRDCLGAMVASRLLSRAGGDEYVDTESEFLRRTIPGLEPDSRTTNDIVPVLVSDPQDWYVRSLRKKTLVVLEAALDFVKFAYIPEAMLISEGGIFDDITAASVTYRDFFEHLRPHGEFAASGSDYGGGSNSVSLAFDDPLYEQRQVLRNGVPSLFHNPAELEIRHFMVLESMVISPRVIDLKVAANDTALGRALRGHLYQDFSSCGMTVPMLVGSRKGGDISDMDLVDTYRQFDRRFNADAARLRASHADQVKKRRIAHSRALVECGGIAPEETETIMEWRRRIHASEVQRLSTGFFLSPTTAAVSASSSSRSSTPSTRRAPASLATNRASISPLGGRRASREDSGCVSVSLRDQALAMAATPQHWKVVTEEDLFIEARHSPPHCFGYLVHHWSTEYLALPRSTPR